MNYRNFLHQEISLHVSRLPVFRFGLVLSYLVWYILFCIITISLTLVYCLFH